MTFLDPETMPETVDATVLEAAEPLSAPTPRAGALNCSRCSCPVYGNTKQNENDYCDCGHSYYDHY